MKRLFLLLFLFHLHTAWGQPTDTVPTRLYSREQLLSRAKTQKVAGWIITGTGAPVFLVSLYCLVGIPSDAITKSEVAPYFALSGIYTLAGVLLVKAGKRNQKKAVSLSLNMQEVQMPWLARAPGKKQPALTLRLALP